LIWLLDKGLDSTMCLGVPMQIKTLEGLLARCEAKGVEREVSLLMLADTELVPGDFLVVHLGYATERITQAQAQAAWAIYDEMLAATEA
jgi:hydrogenase expression/formation protein HypC